MQSGEHSVNENRITANAILSQILYITLATVSPDGLPWNAPVYAAFDEAYHFFWVSAREARHSRNIRATSRVAIVVYDSTVPANTGKAVYIEATAEELTDEQEIAHALQALKSRGWATPPPVQELVESATSPRRVYRAAPQRMWISSDERINGYVVDARTEVDLFST